MMTWTREGDKNTVKRYTHLSFKKRDYSDLYNHDNGNSD